MKRGRCKKGSKRTAIEEERDIRGDEENTAGREEMVRTKKRHEETI